MKSLLCLLILFSVGSILTFAQTDKNAVCPTISVTGPAGIAVFGDLLIFTAIVESENLKSIKYHWTVSRGQIISGQGTLTISVSTAKWESNVTTATLEIIGLPERCPAKVSETYNVSDENTRSILVEEYKNISFTQEKSRLQKIDIEPIEKGIFSFYFITGTTNRRELRAAKTRVLKIEKFLTEVRKIPKDKITFVFNNAENYRTKVYLVPIGSEPPDSE